MVRTECINEYFLKITKISETKFFYFQFFSVFCKIWKKIFKNIMSNDTKCAKKMFPIFESIMVIRFNYVQNIAIPFLFPLSVHVNIYSIIVHSAYMYVKSTSRLHVEILWQTYLCGRFYELGYFSWQIHVSLNVVAVFLGVIGCLLIQC